jgi:hypothetical protein
MFLAPTFALNYALSFAALISVIIHSILFNGKEIWYRMKAARNQEPDIHMKLMAKYKEAPDWWYGALFLVSIALGLATVLGYPSQLPCKYQDLVNIRDLTENRVGILRLDYLGISIHCMSCKLSSI